jgi:glycosyltransferase involved in cell wall biosynthesis
MGNKIRILITGDNSLANTGYARFKYEILNHLYFEHDDEFEVAEFAYCLIPQFINRLPWKTYNSLKAHGRNEWDSVILDFKPDLVFSPTDYYMWEYQARSVFKDRYSLIVAPAFDRGPLPGACIGSLANADVVFGITKFGGNLMESRGIPVKDIIPIPIDENVFKPLPNIKKQFGLDGKIVYGFVGRNQTRKRIPELLKGFVEFLKLVDNPSDHYLFYHGSIYEKQEGWDVGTFLLRYGLTKNFLLTYINVQTKEIKILPYQDVGFFGDSENWLCVNSEQSSIDNAKMAKIYNVMDYYVQASRSEGFGMPMVEAAMCGIPVFALDGSCMREYTGKKEFAYPIRCMEDHQPLRDGSEVPIPLAQDYTDIFYEINNKKHKAKKYKHPIKNVLESWTKEFKLAYKNCNRISWDKKGVAKPPEVQAESASELIRSLEQGFPGRSAWYELKQMYEVYCGRLDRQKLFSQFDNRQKTLQQLNK